MGPRKLRPDVLSSWGRESPHTGHRWLPPSVDPSDGFSIPFPKSTLCESHVSLTSGAVFIVALIYSSSFLCLPPSGCCSPSGIHFGASYTGTWPGAGFLLCVSHGPLNGRQQVPTSSAPAFLLRGGAHPCTLPIGADGHRWGSGFDLDVDLLHVAVVKNASGSTVQEKKVPGSVSVPFPQRPRGSQWQLPQPWDKVEGARGGAAGLGRKFMTKAQE